MRNVVTTVMSSRWRLIPAACVAMWASVVLSGALAAHTGDPQRGDPQRGDPRGMGATGITVFVEAGFKGPNANFREDVPDIRRYNLNDRVDSLQIPRGETWEVCADINYKGRCQTFSADEADLGRVGWGGTISSLRRVVADDRRGGGFGDARGGGAGDGRGGGFDDGRGGGRGYGQQFPDVRARLVLFDDFAFRGRSFVVSTATPTLRALGNRARSAKAYGGAWEVCDGDRFLGRCEIISDSMPDLGRIGMRDRISSVRPVGRGR